MITVADALAALFALARPPQVEEVPLRAAAGRVLVRTVTARRTQPPFAASAMDGYAVTEADARPGAVLRVIGTAAAGHGFAGAVTPGEAVRIFTGAPVPAGATRVVIQEDVARDGDRIRLGDRLDTGTNLRPAGADFQAGDPLPAPRRLGAHDVALLAAMNVAAVPVARRPDVAIIATGDELVQPGEEPGPDQIIASNSYGLAALLAQAGAAPRLLPIARDTPASLRQAFALAAGADLIITIGGASVGEHDIVAPVAAELGMDRAFYKVAMRPGKPLMAGRLGPSAMVGLPGNPVSALVCGHIFVLPLVRAMLGLPAAPAPRITLPLAAPVDANGPREHYQRARRTAQGVAVFERQDSSLLSILAAADCLVVRPPHDPARAVGAPVEVIALG